MRTTTARSLPLDDAPASRPLRLVRPAGAAKCRKHFLTYFPDGFRDETYVDWERGYKWAAHERWEEKLGAREFSRLLRAEDYAEIAARAIAIESRTNLLFSFEKMALRDAVRSNEGARTFARGLHAFVHGRGDVRARLEAWVDAVGALPRKQTRVLTWPLVTVFGFLARPDEHVFLKPNVTKRAASRYGFDFRYASRPNGETYESLLAFVGAVRREVRDLRPRDMIDLQSFVWVCGSDDEYPW